MTSDEMSMVKTIMGLTWDTAYEYGRIGLFKEREINNKNMKELNNTMRSAVDVICGVCDTAYEYGKIGFLKESEIINKNKNDYIENLIRAAHLEVNKKG